MAELNLEALIAAAVKEVVKTVTQAQAETGVTTVTAPVNQDALNRNHYAERVSVDPVRAFVKGEMTNSPMPNFQGGLVGDANRSVRETIVRMFRETPQLSHAVVKVGVESDVTVTGDKQYDCHRNGNVVRIFSQDGVYKNEVALA